MPIGYGGVGIGAEGNASRIFVRGPDVWDCVGMR